MAKENSNTPSAPPTPEQHRVDDDTLRRWLADCDPYRPLPLEDHRYFDFNEPVPGTDRPLRGRDHIAYLKDAIELSEDGSCQLFSGFGGTGKSTELARLAEDLEGTGYSVLLVNGQDYHDLNHPLAIEDLMVLIAGSFGDATERRLGKKVKVAGYWERLRDFVRRLEVSEVGLTVIPDVADLKIGIKNEKSFWVDIREALNRAPQKLREFSHRYIQECVRLIEQVDQPSKGVVFILDSMEKLSALPPDFHQTMESVFRVLVDFPDFLHLPRCHVIYTVPPYVQLINPTLTEKYRVAHVLPSIKVLERDAKVRPYRPGVEALAELLRRRIPVDEIFAGRPDLLERLILASAGHVRTLIAFVRDLLFQARRRGLPPTDADVEEILQPFRQQARMRVWRESAPLLQRILETQTIEGIRKEEYETVARFMDSYLVLCYRNGEDWYEVHPLVREHVTRLAGEVAREGRSGPGEGE